MQKLLFFSLFALFLPIHCTLEPSDQTKSPSDLPFDWQGHRGARGLLPENSIPGFLKALEFPAIRTLELDIVISGDGHPIVSHEPWMSAAICRTPDSLDITEDLEQSHRIYQMTIPEIRAYDCGSKGNERFPEQKPLRVFKPLLIEIIDIAETYAQEFQRPAPFYNIELKARPEWDSIFTPPPAEFVDIVLKELRKRPPVRGRVVLQSFDKRILQEIRRRDPSIPLSYLVENVQTMDENLAELGFTPQIYSPYYPMVTANVVQEAHKRQMRIVPWTVNTTAEMQQLKKMGVDGIITDYPDRIPSDQ